jgi:3-hydroxyacyl-[acyl-carrier-protein] dehydratase
MSLRRETPFRIPADHPSLPGHFPGAPVVPGVVLLEEILVAAQACFGERMRIVSIPQVKFLAPLLPDEPATALLELNGQELRFRVQRGGRILVQGQFTLITEHIS